MLQPEHTLRRQATTSGRIIGLSVVAGLHLLVVWAVIISLNSGLLQKLPEELKAEVVQQPPPQEKLPPPPPPDMVKPPPPFVPPPDITIQSEAPVTNTITTQSTVATPAPKPAAAPSPVISVATDCAASNYPPVAMRLNQTGTATVLITVGTDGEPKDVKVVESSGHDSLDEASIRCVMSHWHFKPAMQNGAPVEGQKEIRIRWQLSG